MAENSRFSFSDPFLNGIDFFTPDDSKTISVSIQLESSVVVQSEKIAFANVSLDGNSNVVVSGTKIAYAQANLACEGVTLTLGTKLKLAEISVNVSSNLSVAAYKFANASSSLEVNSNATITSSKIALANIDISGDATTIASSIKQAYASSQINASSNVNALATLVKFISSSISGNVNLSVVGKIVLITARINRLFNNTNITTQALRFSPSINADSTLVRTLLMLDGTPLTNQNRQFDISVTPIFVENFNWQGDASRYYKNTSSLSGGKRIFNVQWRFIPNYENKTVDLRASRNYINKKSKDGDVHILTILKQDEDGTTPYTEENIDVLITDYSENLIRRDLVDDVYYFDCSLSLEEV